jgi:alpha-beta hydrolase superfamily lysophospholipase
MSGFSDERVSFTNDSNEKLSGLLRVVDQLGPIVVLCHGLLSDKNHYKPQMLADELARRGMGSLRFDFSGHGESEGRFFDTTLTKRRQDLAAAIGFASEHTEALGLFGSSVGGTTCLLQAARDSRIVAVAVSSPHSDLDLLSTNRVVEERLRRSRYPKSPRGARPSFLEDLRKHDVRAAVRQIDVPLLAVHGSADAWAPCAASAEIVALAKNGRLELVEGADHSYSEDSDMRLVLELVATFFEDHLKPPR